MKPAAGSLRVKKARLRHLLHKKSVRQAGGLIVAVTVGWAIAGIFMHLPLFYLGLVVGVPLAMLLEWYEGELAILVPTSTLQEMTSYEAVLEPELLANLPRNPSMKQLVEACAHSYGGRFYAARFRVPVMALAEQANTEPDSATAIWPLAARLAEQVGNQMIDASNVTAAIILSAPIADQMLAQLGLEREDIIAGSDWYKHIEDAIAKLHEQQNFGGIGRDLAFGFTPLLNRFGYNMTQKIQYHGLMRRKLAAHDRVLDNMVQLLANGARRNIALVGEIGSGRTTVVYALAERLLTDKTLPQSLRYRQVIGLDASSIISASGGRGQLENLVTRLMHEALRAKNIVLFLDDAHLFLEEGNGSVDLSNILLPALEGGALRLILTLTDSWWQRLNQTNPALVQLLNRVNMSPLDKQSTLQAIEDQVPMLEYQRNITYTYQALLSAYDLASRFVPDQVFPGRAISLLEAAANFPVQGFITVASVEQAIEQRFGVKIQRASDQQDREKLLHLEDEIHKHMVNQTRAVKVVSEALRRARAGVRNTSRPIGTFLFLGPTGVGKTELSKSLARVYFGGEQQIVRIDLNEFGEASTAGRLLESAATNPNSLCALIAKQPFSVVLLDEIEKAHPNVLNVLLQMLDEGILHDVNNREVNFREAIIIATSNAGADRIREHIARGEQPEQFEKEFEDELINSHEFRPEFLNRFDEIVIFRPLTPQELIQVVDIIVTQINQTLAAQKVSIALSEEAKQWLVQQGYDPRLGARPLRRVVQRTVESVVAKRILEGSVSNGSVLTLGLTDLNSATQSPAGTN